MRRVSLLCVWLVFFFFLFPFFFFFNVAKNSPAKKFRVLAELSQVSVLWKLNSIKSFLKCITCCGSVCPEKCPSHCSEKGPWGGGGQCACHPVNEHSTRI